MGHAVNWPLVSALKGREGLLGRPWGGGGLLSHWGGLDEAAVEGVLWVVVGYWEQKTNAEAKRSVRGYCTVLQEQQSVLTHSHNCCGVAESVGLGESAEKLGFTGSACELTKAPTLWKANELSSICYMLMPKSWSDSGFPQSVLPSRLKDRQETAIRPS